MRKFLIQAFLLILVTVIALFLTRGVFNISNLPFLPPTTVYKQVVVGDNKIRAEIADTQEKRAKGLSQRDSLAQDEGMLFVFPKTDKYSFWMKGLNFPLDFVWIRGDKVVEIYQNIQPPTPGQPDSALPVFLPREEVDKVLELNAGTVQKLDIKVDDPVMIEEI